MILRGRRDFLKGGGLAVGVLAADGCAVPGSAAPRADAASIAPPGSGSQVASFGWEACNLKGNGANMFVKVQQNMILQSVNIDLSASILEMRGSGFAEILCVGGVSRQGAPSFDNSPHAYVNFPLSSNFGSVTAENPHNLSLFFDGAMLEGQFLAVILKTWVPNDGTACATSRQVLAYPSITLNAGDYLVFHMDHEGVDVDAEMQIVLQYTLT